MSYVQATVPDCTCKKWDREGEHSIYCAIHRRLTIQAEAFHLGLIDSEGNVRM